MRRSWWVLLLLAAALPARADLVVLVDGRVLHGSAVRDGDVVVVQQRFGETRLARDAVRSITTDAELARKAEAERAQRAAEAERKRAAAKARADERPAPPPSRLTWEPDAERAAKRAAEQEKLVLTFLVLGELGTGRC